MNQQLSKNYDLQLFIPKSPLADHVYIMLRKEALEYCEDMGE